MSLLALLSVGVQAQATRDGSSTPPITIYADFGSYSANVRPDLESQLGAIMSPLGLKFEWRDLRTTRRDTVAELVVVSFKADCTTPPRFFRRTDPTALAWTHVNDSVVIPFIDVCCDRVQNTITPLLRRMPSEKQQGALGRALARVLAHELYHVLAQTTQHASAGAGKATFSAEDLVSPDFHFGPKEYTLLWRARLRNTAQSHTSAMATDPPHPP